MKKESMKNTRRINAKTQGRKDAKQAAPDYSQIEERVTRTFIHKPTGIEFIGLAEAKKWMDWQARVPGSEDIGDWNRARAKVSGRANKLRQAFALAGIPAHDTDLVGARA